MFYYFCHLIALSRKGSCYLHTFLLPISYLEIIILPIGNSLQMALKYIMLLLSHCILPKGYLWHILT